MGMLAEANSVYKGSYPEQHVAEEAIIDSAVDLLVGRIGVGGVLEEVEEVIRGDSDREPALKPALWVVGGESRAQEAGRTQGREVVVLELVIQADVSDREAQVGYRRARNLAHLAGKELMRDENGKRNHTLGGHVFINDVYYLRSGQLPPVLRGTYSHVVRYGVRFVVGR